MGSERQGAWPMYRLPRQGGAPGRSRGIPLVDMDRRDVLELANRTRHDVLGGLAALAFLRDVADGMPGDDSVGDTFTEPELEALHLAAERRVKHPPTKEH